ncbi:hypothetical protein BN1723_009802 [Verticillium longisporum]|uniref:ATP-dependent DNA helicase n=1 Tax=Verticillium longisporum TaxID=100787 RepID=A0A0G4KSX0_VERLO|nr:hypothetical protein BN1723_009802 [Verticillium longisporum]
MDSDDYDDDIADEDLAEAFSQSDRAVGSSASRANSNTISSSRSLSITHPSTINTARAPNYQNGMKASEMDELLAAAFSSSPELEPVVAAPPRAPRQPFGRTSSNGFRQTTLFGGTVNDEEDADSRPIQPGFGRVYRADKPVEATHHELNNEALKTWVYPKNLGAVRDYQYSIVKNGLFKNTLVALPTGLGKTFIAATVMLNFHRWTKTAKIVFVAPTKPLVAQQVDACFNIVGISRSETTMLTGDVAPAIRVDEWQTKRVFFMTPQTLLNDISRGYADPKSIVLLVVDEAHRSTGEYAYAKFHMPDGVETGFVTASRVGLLDGSVSKGPKKKTPKKATPAAPCELDQLAEIPPLDSVLLNTRQMAELDRNYRTLPFNRSKVEEIEVVDINAHPALNRRLRPVGKVQHGARTKKYVELMQTWTKKYKDPAKKWHRPYGDQDTSRWKEIPFPPFAPDTDDERPPKVTKKRQSASLGVDDDGPEKAPRAKKRKSNGPAKKAPLDILPDAEEGDDLEHTVCEAPQRGRPKKAAVPKARGRKPKKRAPQKRGGINSDELGDDCDRDSDMDDTDGSDDGADLLDFVVGDDHPISSLRDVSDDLPSSVTSTPAPTRTKLKPFFEPLSLPATQDSTDDLPDLSVVTARTGLATKTARRGKPTVVDDSDTSENMNDPGNEFDEVDDDDLQPRGQPSRHNRRRTVIDESDEDNY